MQSHAFLPFSLTLTHTLQQQPYIALLAAAVGRGTAVLLLLFLSNFSRNLLLHSPASNPGHLGLGPCAAAVDKIRSVRDTPILLPRLNQPTVSGSPSIQGSCSVVIGWSKSTGEPLGPPQQDRPGGGQKVALVIAHLARLGRGCHKPCHVRVLRPPEARSTRSERGE